MKMTGTTYAAGQQAACAHWSNLGILSEMTGYARNRRCRYAPYIELFNYAGAGCRTGGAAREPVRLPAARVGRGVRVRCAGRGGRPRRSAHGLLLRPARARTGGGLGLQARRGAEAAVPGQPLGADPRAELQAGRGRGGVQQGAGHQHAGQPRRAQPSRDPARRRDGRGARAVPRGVLARPHLRPRGAAGAGPGLRCERVAEGRRRCRRQTAEQLQQLEAGLRERDEKLAACWPTRPRSTRSSSACAPRWPRRSRPQRPSPTPTTTPRPRPATTSSTCC